MHIKQILINYFIKHSKYYNRRQEHWRRSHGPRSVDCRQIQCPTREIRWAIHSGKTHNSQAHRWMNILDTG